MGVRGTPASSFRPSFGKEFGKMCFIRCKIHCFLTIPTLILFIASNPGLFHHVHGRQVRAVGGERSLEQLTRDPFDNNTGLNLTVPLGDNAFLRCKVRNLGERSVSWIRRRDWHILTTGKTTFTNDERFHVLHTDGSDEWTLQIKFVQKRDNGTYECQVSTGTGIVSYLVHLRVAVPEAFILGNGEYHVELKSTINLVCIIEKSPKAPEYIFWYHNERMINYGSAREVSVLTELGSKTQSRLTIHDAHVTDSGNYTCKTAHADPASIIVYVSQASGLFSGDKMAAIQRRKAGASSSSPSSPHRNGYMDLCLFLSESFFLLSSTAPIMTLTTQLYIHSIIS